MNILGKRWRSVLLLILLFSVGLAGCSKETNAVDTPAEIAAQKIKDDALITKYLAANNIKAYVVDSSGVATGIYYKVDSAGAANPLYTNSTSITVGYTTWLLNTNAILGPAIQTTNQFNPSFILGEVLDGWQLAFEDIPNTQTPGNNSPLVPGPGGAITLYVPSAYAYGPYPQSDLGLPANSVLIFHIIIYNVTN
jgi:FKBP-type peptidyl-prolyl cis-trans isomerase FkpA